MSNANKIKLITFDAYNTLFKPRGSLSAQYASIRYALSQRVLNCLFQVEEAKKYGIRVTKDQITTHFGQSYRVQQLKAPFYGINQGMNPKSWWKEVGENV